MKTSKDKILKIYGVEIDSKKLKNIQIVKRDEKSITYFDEEQQEFITASLANRVYDKWKKGTFAASITSYNPTQDYSLETFYNIKLPISNAQAAANLLKAQQSQNILLKRFYTNVKTIYGDFCIHVEENLSTYKEGPYRQLSIYHGNSQEIMLDYKNDFNYRDYCLFQHRHIFPYHYDEWVRGFQKDSYEKQKYSSWNYESTNNEEKNIYGCKLMKGDFAGMILLDGEVALADIKNQIDDFFPESCFQEYESIPCNSKAYFHSFKGEELIILKQDAKLDLVFENKKTQTKNTQEIESTDEPFTASDFIGLPNSLKELDLSAEFYHYIVSELMTYLNTHNYKDFKKVETSIANCSFEELVDCLKKSNLKEELEKILLNMQEMFNMGEDELLGSKLDDIKLQKVRRVK